MFYGGYDWPYELIKLPHVSEKFSKEELLLILIILGLKVGISFKELHNSVVSTIHSIAIVYIAFVFFFIVIPMAAIIDDKIIRNSNHSLKFIWLSTISHKSVWEIFDYFRCFRQKKLICNRDDLVSLPLRKSYLTRRKRK